jgi:mannosyltransferase OCH1-like enzyme
MSTFIKNISSCIVSAIFSLFVLLQGNLSAESLIPSTAHFCYGLWDDDQLPPFFEETMTKWQKQGWTVRLWGRKDVDLLLSKYPALEALSATFARKVQKADLARYLIIYENGGFYFDLDCRPMAHSLYKDMHDPRVDASTVFFIECHITPEFAANTRQIPIRQGRPEDLERIANFAFGAVAGHPILWDTLELLQLRCHAYPEFNSDYDILYKTGPDGITESVHTKKLIYKSPDVRIIDHKYYMKHTCAGTWRNDQDL